MFKFLIIVPLIKTMVPGFESRLWLTMEPSGIVRLVKPQCLLLCSMTLKHGESGKETLVYEAKDPPITRSSFAPTHTSYYQSLEKKMHQFLFPFYNIVLVRRTIS